jgi:hypothetical protein
MKAAGAAGHHQDRLRRGGGKRADGRLHAGGAGRIGSLGDDGRVVPPGCLLGRSDQRRCARAVLVEQSQALDADGRQVLCQLVDLVAQAGTNAVQQRGVGTDFSGAVAHQRDPVFFQQARIHQIGDVAAAEIARQHQRPVLRQQLASGAHGVLRTAPVVFPHQREGVAVDAA